MSKGLQNKKTSETEPIWKRKFKYIGMRLNSSFKQKCNTYNVKIMGKEN